MFWAVALVFYGNLLIRNEWAIDKKYVNLLRSAQK